MHPGGCAWDKDTLAGAKFQVPVRTFEEFSYRDLTRRFTKCPSNEMQKPTCITSRRQMMKALVTTEAKAKPKLGQRQAKTMPRLGHR